MAIQVQPGALEALGKAMIDMRSAVRNAEGAERQAGILGKVTHEGEVQIGIELVGTETTEAAKGVRTFLASFADATGGTPPPNAAVAGALAGMEAVAASLDETAAAAASLEHRTILADNSRFDPRRYIARAGLSDEIAGLRPQLEQANNDLVAHARTLGFDPPPPTEHELWLDGKWPPPAGG